MRKRLYSIIQTLFISFHNKRRFHNNLISKIKLYIYISSYLGGVVIERPPRMRHVSAAIPGRVIPTTGWCQDKWASITDNLPMKRRDITEQILKWHKKTHQATFCYH